MYSYNDTDIGVQPGSGMKSPSLSATEIEEELPSAMCQIRPNQMLSTTKMSSKETASLKRKACAIFTFNYTMTIQISFANIEQLILD